MKKLRRSGPDKRFIAGVLGGISDFFSIEPTAVRVVFFFFVLFTGFFPGVVAYIIAIFLIPPEDEYKASRAEAEVIRDAETG